MRYSPLPGKDGSWSGKTTTLQSDDNGDDYGNYSGGGASDSKHGDDWIDGDGDQHLDCVKSHAFVIGFCGR